MTENYQIVIIEAGPGGYIVALKSVQMDAKTAIVENNHLGGTCLNVGCIPTKAILYATDIIQEHAVAMKNELTVEDIANTIHPHPIFAEAVGEAAEGWEGLPLHSM